MDLFGRIALGLSALLQHIDQDSITTEIHGHGLERVRPERVGTAQGQCVDLDIVAGQRANQQRRHSI